MHHAHDCTYYSGVVVLCLAVALLLYITRIIGRTRFGRHLGFGAMRGKFIYDKLLTLMLLVIWFAILFGSAWLFGPAVRYACGQ